jgi:hypothetical protein
LIVKELLGAVMLCEDWLFVNNPVGCHKLLAIVALLFNWAVKLAPALTGLGFSTSVILKLSVDKFKVAILSHPSALVNVALYVPAAVYVVPANT